MKRKIKIKKLTSKELKFIIGSGSKGGTDKGGIDSGTDAGGCVCTCACAPPEK